MANRVYTARERRLLAEYGAFNWKGARVIYNPRLGPVPLQAIGMLAPNVPAAALSSYRRYPDALVIWPDRILMVEAKIIASGGAVGMLEEYLLLWPNSPDYQAEVLKPIQGAILTAFTDPIARQLAASHGMQWLIYSPSWIQADLMSSTFNMAPAKVSGLGSTLQDGGS